MAASFCKTDETCKENLEFGNENVSPESFRNVEKKENFKGRSTFYKKPIKKNNVKLELDINDTPQEIRRQRILYYQKQNRDASLNARRGLFENELESDNGEEMEAEEIQEEMEVELVNKKRNKVYKEYTNMCMLSEWMLEVPQDFAEKWIMVPCPLGKRVLVVAYKGSTKMYSRKGLRLHLFKSVLPGGSPRNNRNSFTILDCIWDKDREMCYILDILAWSNQEMLNCDTEFRFYWIKSQIEELTSIKEQIEGINDYPFTLLPTVPCDQRFDQCLQSISSSILLDGLLFYHKETHYTCGKTPLVVWLKTYMLPEVLGMNVPEPYNTKPDSYIDFEHHVLEVVQSEKTRVDKFQRRRKKQKDQKDEDMEG